MFTGIISTTSHIQAIKPTKGGLQVGLAKPINFEGKVGDSIALNGVCSTIKHITDTLLFEYMPESLERTTIPTWQVGDSVNVELSLRLSDRLDGHLVQGHVDGAGMIEKIAAEGNSSVFTIKLPTALSKFIAAKGSVTLEGISLTVVEAGQDWFTVKVIPYTLEHTNLGAKKVGQSVNVECDVVAKYLERLTTFSK